MLEVMGIKNANKIVPIEEDQKPKDPVSENMAMMKLEPLKAFFYQDHDAHIAVHQSLLQDPMFQQQAQNAPQGQQMMASAQAHLMEHIGFKYRRDIEKQLGVSLPSPEQEISEEEELAISQVTAMAAQRLLQANIVQMQQQQAQQQAQDPIIQMQQQELQLKAQDSQRKMMESQAKIQMDQAKLALENKKVDSQARQNNVKTVVGALKGRGQ
jgi:hypothetical protein